VPHETPGGQVAVGTLVEVACAVALGVPSQLRTGSHVGVATRVPVACRVDVGRGVLHPPLGHPVGEGACVGVPQLTPGGQVGVAQLAGSHVGTGSRVMVGGLVPVGGGVVQPPLGQPVGEACAVRLGGGVKHPPLAQPVGDGTRVGETQPIGSQVGVATRVIVANRVPVGFGVKHPPLAQLVGEGCRVGRGVRVRSITFVGVPQLTPGGQRVGSGLPVGVALRSRVGPVVGVSSSVLVGVPQIVPGGQRVGSTVSVGGGGS
jgi:hypothetical protein